MGCVLRASGTEFMIDKFLERTNLVPHILFRKGPPKSAEGKPYKRSGLNVLVSDGEFNCLETQIIEALSFLRKHEEEIDRLGQFPGVENICLDFAVAYRDSFIQNESFPPELIRLAGRLGLGIELSIFQATEPSP